MTQAIRKHAARAGAAVAGVVAAAEAIDRASNWYRTWSNHYHYTVSIPSSQGIHREAAEWILDAGNRCRRIKALDELRAEFADPNGQWVNVHGHRVHAKVETSDASGEHTFSRTSIEFRARTAGGQKAILQLCAELEDKRKRRSPQLRIAGKWGWADLADAPTRSLGSVVLKKGQLERVRDDLQQFLDLEGWYNNLGIPWHRGYLFHGPPGTGKTSTAQALAHHFGLPVYYINLSDFSGDTPLMTLVAELPARSMLLLEDVDTLAAARDRDDGADGISMSGLLNALDGAATPHGLIVAMTTNRREALDDALIRPGRIDVDELLGPLDADMTDRLWRLAYNTGAPEQIISKYEGATPAALVETLKTSPTDPGAVS